MGNLRVTQAGSGSQGSRTLALAWPALLAGGLALASAAALPPASSLAAPLSAAGPDSAVRVSAGDSAGRATSGDSARPIVREPNHPVRLFPPFPGEPLMLRIPLADLPYGLAGGYASPSMRQSLDWSVSFTQLADQTIGWAWERVSNPFLHALGAYASLGLFEILYEYLPPGDGWLHEEWHRAVMTRRGISSYDGIYHWDIGASAVSVDHVTDADLATFKAYHPAEFARLPEAGLEGEIESIRLMRRNDFFLDRNSEYDHLHWWIVGANATAYLYYCGVNSLDSDLAVANRQEVRESQRDFTGLDFRAWAYDLRRPDEAYAAGPRGRARDSGAGAGFDRYLMYRDLSPADIGYLHLQAWLSLLNFISPQLIGRDWLPGIDPWKRERFLWNFALVHELTPFGFEVAGDVYIRRGKWAWVCTLQSFYSENLALPGLSGELYRYPLNLGRLPVYITGGASAWMQPSGQRYHASDAAPGGSLLCGVAVPLAGGLELWAEGDAKSAGWVAGNVYLDAAAQGRAGLQLRL